MKSAPHALLRHPVFQAPSRHLVAILRAATQIAYASAERPHLRCVQVGAELEGNCIFVRATDGQMALELRLSEQVIVYEMGSVNIDRLVLQRAVQKVEASVMRTDHDCLDWEASALVCASEAHPLVFVPDQQSWAFAWPELVAQAKRALVGSAQDQGLRRITLGTGKLRELLAAVEAANRGGACAVDLQLHSDADAMRQPVLLSGKGDAGLSYTACLMPVADDRYVEEGYER